MKLVTIPFSHFNTRAKWALEYKGIAYDERPYMPLFHWAGVARHAGLRAGRADRVSTRLSTPALVLDDGEVLSDSSDILAWADRHGEGPALYPSEVSEAILAFERELLEGFGAHVRRIAYANGLAKPHALRASARANVGPAQAAIFTLCSPVVSIMLRRALAISTSNGMRSREKLAPRMNALAERLGDQPFCVGELFSAADITFACMMAPLICPPHNYGARLPRLEDLEPPVQAYITQMRESPLGQRALRLFEARQTP